MATEQGMDSIIWKAVGIDMPDADETVMIFHPAENEPVWMGYYDGARWVSVDGMPIGTAVSHWATMPEGPRS